MFEHLFQIKIIQLVVMNSVENSEKGALPGYDGLRERSSGERKGSVVDASVIQAEIFDERYEKTQRGVFLERLMDYIS